MRRATTSCGPRVARRRPNRSNPVAAGTLLALGLGWALIQSGCASAPPAPQPVSPDASAARDLLERGWEGFRDLRSLAEITVRRGDRVERLAGVLLLRAPSSLRDRKSTRLNSSHVRISYAVFCLKKKKKPTYPSTQRNKKKKKTQ